MPYQITLATLARTSATSFTKGTPTMRLFLLMSVVFALITIGYTNNGNSQPVQHLATVQESTDLDYRSLWHQAEDQLGRGTEEGPQFSASRPRRTGDSANRYLGLRPSPYDGLTRYTIKDEGREEVREGSQEGSQGRQMGEMVEVPQETPEITNPEKTLISRDTLAASTVKVKPTHKCACGKDCKCPPYVCDAKDCQHNYAVIFGSPSCAPCVRMYAEIEQLRKDGYIVFYVDVEQSPEVLEQFNIRFTPTIIVMDAGKPTIRFIGFARAAKIAKHLKTRKQQGLKTTKAI